MNATALQFMLKDRVNVKVGVYVGQRGTVIAMSTGVEKSIGVRVEGAGSLATPTWFRPDEVEKAKAVG